MAYDINRQLRKIMDKHRRRGVRRGAVAAMCCAAALCVAYGLMLPALAMTAETRCGLEEHTHGPECFEARLICGYGEEAYAAPEASPGGEIQPEAAEAADNGEPCAEAAEAPAGEENPAETPEAPAAEEAPGEIPEQPAPEPHVHTDDCYEEVLVCRKTEHVHSPACCSNPEADAVAAQIDALPTPEEVQRTLSSYEEAGDEEGYNAYLAEVMAQASEVYAAYSALTDAQRSAVANSDKLLSLAEGLGINGMMLSEGAEDYATESGGFNGYVNSMTVRLQTGSAPFDAEEGAGNDTSADDKIVRTFDTISYEVQAVFGQRDQAAGADLIYNEQLEFEISMEKKITEARFDLSTMPWLDTGYAEWEIDYWAKDANDAEYVVLKEKKAGDGTKLYHITYNEDGTVKEEKETSINAMVLGSSPDGGVPYQTGTGGVVRQSLIGRLNVCTDGGKASGTQDFTTGIRVRNAQNGAEFTPSFKAWFTKNESNYGAITNGTSTASNGNQAEAEAVTVSCAPLYNLTLEESTEYVNYLSWYDFSSGGEVTDGNLLAYLEAAGSLRENYGKANPADYVKTGTAADGGGKDCTGLYDMLTDAQKASLADIRYGRMNALGITMSLASGVLDKGYKGCSLPVGDITFDLDLGVAATANQGSPKLDGYSAILWDYRPNVAGDYLVTYSEPGKTRQVSDPSVGNIGRNLLWHGIEFSQYGSRMAVAAYRGKDGPADTTAYDSGTWTLTQIDGESANTSSAASANSVYTFTVSDYDFDLDNYLYPDRYYGESAPNGRLGVTDFAFFGGFAQVLYVMPYANGGTVDVYRQLTLGNLEATNLSNQTLNEGITHGKDVSAAGEANMDDNTVTSAITQYSVGEFTKRNGFNTADATNHTHGASGKSFLGSEFWGEPQWDENTYAGSDIAIMGSVQLSTASSNTIRAVNLLQLFDSEALSITPKADATDEYITQYDVDFDNLYENTYEGHNPQVAYLFAADPSYPEGYDTNADGVVSYMNTVRYEDLVYADKLYWNDVDKCFNIVKYTIDGVEKELACVGVLSEVRSCNYLDYCYVRVPVTVSDEERFVSKTVCTVNAAEAWIDAGAMDGVSWLNGTWDSRTGKNTLAGYEEIEYAWTAGGNGYYFYNNADSFSKIEYDEHGGLKSGHAGKMEGASLLILGYKASVYIDHQKNIDSTYNTYAPADGETSVNWVVRNIKTEVGTDYSTSASTETNLTIPVTLSYSGGAGESQQQSLFYIAANSSAIAEQAWETDGDGNLILGENGEPIPVYEADDEGNRVQKAEVKSISTDPGNPTEIAFLGTYKDEDGVTKYKLYSYKIYVQEDADGTGLTYSIAGAPVGQTLPDISFNMNLGDSLVYGDSITATAAISGSGDIRAYSTAAGNQSSSTIAISTTGGSDLSKKVDITSGEINASMEYTVTFTNKSSNSLSKAYFYDNLPYNNDKRWSSYDMGEDGTATDGTIVKEIGFRSVTGADLTNDFQAMVTVYYPRGDQAGTYSKMSDLDFKELMYGFEKYADSNGAEIKEEGAAESKLDALLKSNKFNVLMAAEGVFQADPSGPYYKLRAALTDEQRTAYSPVEYKGEYYTTTAPSGADDANYDSTTTKYKRTASYHRTLAVNAGMLVYEGETEVWKTGSWTIEGKTYTDGKAAYEAFLSTIPGVVVKVENMGPSRSIEMKITMGTSENKAGDVYNNDAWQWTVGSAPLKSNLAQTKILGRAISGRVWVDKNLNGVYDEGETLLNGVTCTLFKLNEATGEYVPCTADVAGRPIGAVTSGGYTYSYTRPKDDGAGTEVRTVDAYLNTVDSDAFYRDTHGHEVETSASAKTEISKEITCPGQYSFDALPEGRYIVAFSGGDLDKYGGATSYQVNHKNDDASNDGVALNATEGSNLDKDGIVIYGIDKDTYQYAIAYDLTGNTVGNVNLHSIDDIVNNNITLTNSVELYDHQDLGLVLYAGMVLPETGGIGTAPFRIIGLVLVLCSGVLPAVRRRGIGDRLK